MLTWLLTLLGALAALLAATAIVGLFLPRAHEATRSAVLPEPPAVVFALITDTAALPAWRPDVRRVETLPPRGGHAVYREHSAHGALSFEVLAVEPPARYVTRIVDESAFGGTWEYTLAPDGASGTRLTITERGEVYNPVFRTLSRFVFGHATTIERYLAALGAHLSRGR